jgi:divalent metal cation (Fe/Co/Zn/Cd) transporter
VGVILAGMALFLVRESGALLVGESAPAELVASIHALVLADAAVREAGAPLTMQLGPDQILVNLRVTFAPGLSARDLTDAIARVERAIREKHPKVQRIFIEAGPPCAPGPESPAPA